MLSIALLQHALALNNAWACRFSKYAHCHLQPLEGLHTNERGSQKSCHSSEGNGKQKPSMTG